MERESLKHEELLEIMDICEASAIWPLLYAVEHGCDEAELSNVAEAMGLRKGWEYGEGLDDPERALEVADELMGGYGVEMIGAWAAGGDRHLKYVNLGDTYDVTLAVEYDVPASSPHMPGTFRRFLVTSWGGWYEREEQRITEERADQ